MDRNAGIELLYQGLGPMVRFLGQKVGLGKDFLDVGSGEGIISLKVAEDLQARRVVLVDRHPPIVELPAHAEFHQLDVHSKEFVRRFQNKVEVVLCLNALHEFDNITLAVTNIISILPISGIALILDYSEEGWERQRSNAVSGTVHCREHFIEDMGRAQSFGLDTNSGIREVWEDGFFPRMPGECCLSFGGDLYSVLYVPRQWGEVKEPPPDIKRVLESRSR